MFISRDEVNQIKGSLQLLNEKLDRDTRTLKMQIERLEEALGAKATVKSVPNWVVPYGNVSRFKDVLELKELDKIVNFVNDTRSRFVQQTTEIKQDINKLREYLNVEKVVIPAQESKVVLKPIKSKKGKK